jgi:hypothetical protein
MRQHASVVQWGTRSDPKTINVGFGSNVYIFRIGKRSVNEFS